MDHSFLKYIEDHLKGKLSLEELHALARAHGVMNIDREVEWFRRATLYTHSVGRDKTTPHLITSNGGDPGNEKIANTVGSVPQNAVFFIIAACLLLILSLTTLLRPTKCGQLYNAFKFIDPGIPIPIIDHDNYGLYDALSFYSEGAYDEAIKRFISLDHQEAPYRDTVEFYLGASYLYSGDIEQSVSVVLPE